MLCLIHLIPVEAPQPLISSYQPVFHLTLPVAYQASLIGAGHPAVATTGADIIDFIQVYG